MKNLAKLTALTLTAALALTACGSTADSAAPAESTADTAATEETGGDLLSQIQASGTITVAMGGHLGALDLPRRERQPRRLRR